MATTQILKSFCTTREAAQILGISLRTAQMWAETGLLEGWKTEGGHRRITRASIERLLANDGHPPAGTDKDTGDRPFQIMVVEDNEDLLKLYRLNLGRWPLEHRLIAINNGWEALIKLGSDKPDLLIADLFMPGFDGFMMLKSIRAVPEYKDLPIVVVTGLSPGDIVSRGGLPEDITILTKPIPFAELQRLTEELASRKQRGK